MKVYDFQMILTAMRCDLRMLWRCVQPFSSLTSYISIHQYRSISSRAMAKFA